LIVAGAGVGAYVLFKVEDGQRLAAEAAKLEPAIAGIVGQGERALRTLIESAQAGTQAGSRASPSPERDPAKLPFIILEHRDVGAPTIRLPPQAGNPELTRTPPAQAFDLEPVEARLRTRVPRELFAYFDLYLYVSKAASEKGRWAQRMFVLAKQTDQTLALLHDWAVSTGLETPVLSPSGVTLGTNTPPGMFKLDRGRFYRDYTSRQWESPMPNAMFFDWQRGGNISGMAIHGADEEGVKTLGERASHGCIRLAPEHARILFDLIQTNYKGRVPAFQIHPESGTMSTVGALVRDENGRVVMTRGYKVLVFIEDYGGPSVDTIAALY
jgi:lipoprotein-anchoring transpeptidase ErfK/SrfK